MAGSNMQWWMITPLLVLSSTASVASDIASGLSPEIDPFSFNVEELDSIQFTRAKEVDHALSVSSNPDAFGDLEKDFYRYSMYDSMSRQTQFSFKLKPKLPNFSREGAYGLDLFDAPQFNIQSYLTGPSEFGPYASYLHNGFEYSAGVRIEHEQDHSDDTAFMSSSLLGLSYGRLGRLWYGAIDLNLEQFAADRFGSESTDIVSLDVTTGRRFSITGLDAHSPLWMLSLQGNFDINQSDIDDDLEDLSNWFINPSLFWQQPGFMFSAQMQLPVEFETLDEDGEPDYRLRAVIEKQFK